MSIVVPVQILEQYFPGKSFEVRSLSGGDINAVYRAKNQSGDLVIKVNDIRAFPGMLEAEAHGLNKIRGSESISVPEVIANGTWENFQFLILQHVEKAQTSANFYENFGRKLAQLHQNTAPNFGLERKNFIGSLPQPNEEKTTWFEFFITQRMEPQIKLASDSGTISPEETKLFVELTRKCGGCWPVEPSALLHGDLWSGNFLCGPASEPYLIDPAVYFGHREMDLGMMQLFGGFHPRIFQVYNEFFPLEKHWRSRIELNQVYPLLVHLNLFGRSYWQALKRILQKF